MVTLLASFALLAPQFPFPGPGRASVVAATTARSFAASSLVSSTSTGYLSSAGSFTMAFWFKSGGLTQTSTYLLEFGNTSGAPAIIYGYTNDGSGHANLEFFDPNLRTSSALAITDTNWHHVAYRYNGTEWAKFLDGTKTVINASISTTLPPGATGIWLGGYSGGSAYVNAALARLYISTSALTDGQITAMASGTCSTSGVSGTVAYWLLGVGSPETESSPSGGSNSLTVPGSGTSVITGPTCSSF